MSPSTRSLILDLLSTLREGSMPVRALVAAGGIFGIAENNIRVALARLLARGSVERDERGQYRLGPRTQAVQAQVASWRGLEDRVTPAWDGSWVAVHTAALTAKRSGPRERRGQALRLLGFRSLVTGLEIRPNNRVGGISKLRRELVDLGLERDALVAELRELDAASEARARSLWDAPALARAASSSRRDLEQSLAGLARLSIEEAMVETFLKGGGVLREIVVDPLLPDAIADPEPRRQLLECMREYDRVGRSCWAAFLGRYDVPHRNTPLDIRVGTASERLRRAS